MDSSAFTPIRRKNRKEKLILVAKVLDFLLVIDETGYAYKREDWLHVVPIGCLRCQFLCIYDAAVEITPSGQTLRIKCRTD